MNETTQNEFVLTPDQFDTLTEPLEEVMTLHTSFSAVPELTRDHALEAARVLGIDHPLEVYYSDLPADQKLSLVMEDLSKAIMVGVAAALAVLVAIITKIVKWIKRRRSGDGRGTQERLTDDIKQTPERRETITTALAKISPSVSNDILKHERSNGFETFLDSLNSLEKHCLSNNQRLEGLEDFVRFITHGAEAKVVTETWQTIEHAVNRLFMVGENQDDLQAELTAALELAKAKSSELHDFMTKDFENPSAPYTYDFTSANNLMDLNTRLWDSALKTDIVDRYDSFMTKVDSYSRAFEEVNDRVTELTAKVSRLDGTRDPSVKMAADAIRAFGDYSIALYTNTSRAFSVGQVAASDIQVKYIRYLIRILTELPREKLFAKEDVAETLEVLKTLKNTVTDPHKS